MTTERIDVLAVMDEMIDCYGSVEECPDDTEFLVAAREARAAVAELIDADKEFDTARWAYEDAKNRGYDDIQDVRARWQVAAVRRRAALARVGGAK